MNISYVQGHGCVEWMYYVLATFRIQQSSEGSGSHGGQLGHC